MATQQEIAIYDGGGFSVPAANVLQVPLPNGTISAVRVKMPSNTTGDAIWNFSINGVAQFTNELTVPDGDDEKDATGLAIVTTDDDLGVFSIEAPFPTAMPDPPYRFYITYDDGTVIDVAGAIHAATGKTTPVDADELGIVDSAASNVLKKLTWANLKATAKTYFDSLYQPVDGDLTTIAGLTATTDSFLQAKSSAWAARTIAQVKTDLNLSGTNTGDQTSVTGNAGTATALQTGRTIDGQTFDGTANITVIAPGTHAATSKATPVDADELPIVDSAASNVLKKLTWANLKATLKTYFDTLYQAVLVSGTNIKTINSTSLLGSGDIAISGSVATDAIFDAKGDLAVGTGADAAAKLTVGSNGTFLKANSAQSTGLEWASIPGGGDMLASNNLSDVANAATARTNLGLGTGNTPQFTGIEVGAASDTTLARVSAGVISVEGATVYTQGGALGTPASGTLTNATGLPVSTGISGLGTNVATELAKAADGSQVDSIGFRGVPLNSQSAAYTTVMSDAGKVIFHPSGDNNARTFTIDSNANVAYPIGTVITFLNQINTVTIAITTDSLTLIGAGTTGSRTLAANGIATAIKVTSTSWMISGVNLT